MFQIFEAIIKTDNGLSLIKPSLNKVKMSNLENKKRIAKKFFIGMKLKNVFPLLKIVANQNGLNLNKHREFVIAKSVLVNSIVNN